MRSPGALRTRGQPVATAAVRSFIANGPPHAILLVGPPSVGKTTLALELGGALLCLAAGPDDRPCGSCRGCRLVATGNHPDLHRLVPEGPGGQIRIGDPVDPAPGTVRRFIRDLALLPVEGGARVAIVEHADRLTDAAQDALLKTLEEPPGGVTILLVADDEERLLPTVRSRCARIRLGTVGIREMEAILAELASADAPTAARLAHVAGGRPGVAIAYARAPEALLARETAGRTLLDLLARRPWERLEAIRILQDEATTAASLLARVSEATSTDDDPAGRDDPGRAQGGRAGRGGRSRDRARRTSRSLGAEGPAEDATEGPDDEGGGPVRIPPAERRRAAAWLIAAWGDLTRDLLQVDTGAMGDLRDPALLDDLRSATVRLQRTELVAFLGRLLRAQELLEANAAPELLLDTLVLAWPSTDPRGGGGSSRTRTVAAGGSDPRTSAPTGPSHAG